MVSFLDKITTQFKVIAAGLGLPTLGYLFGGLVAKLFKQANADALTIGIETGFQNVSLAILFLSFILDQPMADLTVVVPIAIGLLGAIPLIITLVVQKVSQ